MKTKIERLIGSVYRNLLDGEKFPHGKPYDYREEEAKILFSVPKIVQAYDLAQELSEKESGSFLKLIFYLARNLDRRYNESDLNTCTKDKSLLKKIKEIASEGRLLSLSVPKTTEERIASAKLYSDELNIFSAQLQDPKRGCSASLCTNCDEPIAFCDYTCPTCNYELIGAHNMPTVEKWLDIGLPQRLGALEWSYTQMMHDISQRGDWRGTESPLNRFKFGSVR